MGLLENKVCGTVRRPMVASRVSMRPHYFSIPGLWYNLHRHAAYAGNFDAGAGDHPI